MKIKGWTLPEAREMTVNILAVDMMKSFPSWNDKGFNEMVALLVDRIQGEPEKVFLAYLVRLCKLDDLGGNRLKALRTEVKWHFRQRRAEQEWLESYAGRNGSEPCMPEPEDMP